LLGLAVTAVMLAWRFARLSWRRRQEAEAAGPACAEAAGR
jgi:hypothetical protein